MLEEENDLLLAQHAELEGEVQRLGALLQQRDAQALQLQAAAAAAAASAAGLRGQLAAAEKAGAANYELKEKLRVSHVSCLDTRVPGGVRKYTMGNNMCALICTCQLTVVQPFCHH